MYSAEDLAYFANVLNQISRPKQAAEYIDQLINMKPALTHSEYELFGLVYKSAIEPIRKTLRSLMGFYDEEVDGGHALRAESIQIEKRKSHIEYTKICHHVIDLITDTLLPNAADQKAQIFYNKTLGDYYRYLAEFESNEEAKKVISEAEKAYNQALNVCTTDLLPCDPLRLSVILNYAIFKYEHLKQTNEATELLQNAKKEAEPELGQLSQNSQNEALQILTAIRDNLIIWFDDENDKDQIA